MWARMDLLWSHWKLLQICEDENLLVRGPHLLPVRHIQPVRNSGLYSWQGDRWLPLLHSDQVQVVDGGLDGGGTGAPGAGPGLMGAGGLASATGILVILQVSCHTSCHTSCHSNWYPSNPSGGAEDKLELIGSSSRGMRWNDGRDSYGRGAVCQYKPSSGKVS